MQAWAEYDAILMDAFPFLPSFKLGSLWRADHMTLLTWLGMNLNSDA